jgi:hypothetical protein
MSISDVVVLSGGVSVTRQALQLAWELEHRGCTLLAAAGDVLRIRPGAVLTAADRDAIVRFKADLIRLARYCERVQ